ncbi:MAG: adenylate/guanylate cyclase domain-containing protein [Opitutus sp.]|nr:adenylate/guanylate cyclase domain-containing protein [Opitutus sp.]
MPCPTCSFENPPGFRFCGRCGANLAAGASAVPVAPMPPPAPPAPVAARNPDAERRQLTLLFCDLVGSTTMGELLDPEELREIVQDYQAACAAAVAPFGGHIAQYLGDGILIYFGYPVASEDSPRRAVHAGLAILEGVARLNERVAARRPVRLAVRVGIHTGSVVTGAVGGAGRTEPLAIGSAPNVAARLQSLAEPDTVVLSGTTHRLVEGFFEFVPLGRHQLKGLAQSVEVYRAIRDTGTVSRFEVTASRGLVPLVGRESELEILLGGFERARGGAGHPIAVLGEPGIGKSRLMEMFRERLADRPHAWRVCRCSPYASRSALQPVVDMLEQRCEIDRGTPVALRREKLAHAVVALGQVKPDTLPLLEALLSLPPASDAPPLNLSPERQRQRTLETLVELVLSLAARETLVLTVEDLHWADPSTVELLAMIAERARTATLLLLVLHRPGLVLPWARSDGAVELVLGRLRDEHVAAIIGHVTAGRNLPPELLRQLVAKTDGVPLFVEELTKMVLESGQDLTHAAALTIPTTLHDSLVARLDRLGSLAKEVAQVGAVLGREFGYEMLRAVALHDDASLALALATLVESDLLQQQGVVPDAVFVFKHALIQDAAYGLMVASVRQQHHRRVAEVLEARFPAVVANQPELLARHFTEASVVDSAVLYWLKAGQRANERSANLESIDHVTRGINLLGRLPVGPERDARELALQITLGTASLTRKGYWAQEVVLAFDKALVLSAQLGDTARHFRALMGLCSYHMVRGDYVNGLALAERLLTEAERQGVPAALAQALYCLGFARYYCSDFAGSLKVLERGIALQCEDGDPDLKLTSGDDVRIHALAQAALTAWHLGHVDRAARWSDRSIAMARRLGQPNGISFALAIGAVLRMYRREAGLVASCRSKAWPSPRKRATPLWPR